MQAGHQQQQSSRPHKHKYKSDKRAYYRLIKRAREIMDTKPEKARRLLQQAAEIYTAYRLNNVSVRMCTNRAGCPYWGATWCRPGDKVSRTFYVAPASASVEEATAAAKTLKYDSIRPVVEKILSGEFP